MSCSAHELAVARRFLDWEDVDLIRELVGKLPVDRNIEVVDLGSGAGTTALAVLAERDSQLRITSIDHNAAAQNWAKKAVENVGKSNFLQFILANTVEAAQDFLLDIDLLLIDSSHEYEDTKNELSAWVPKVRSGGFVWLHDYRGPYPGVKRAIDEEKSLKEIGVRGLGWAGRKVV